MFLNLNTWLKVSIRYNITLKYTFYFFKVKYCYFHAVKQIENKVCLSITQLNVGVMKAALATDLFECSSEQWFMFC